MSLPPTEFRSDLGLRSYLDRTTTLFRRYQDQFVAEFGPSLSGRVIEVGGERHNDNGRFLSGADSFTVTNVAREHDEYADLTALPFDDATVDGFLCVSVLEHIRDVSRAWAEMARTLRPGGRLLVVVPMLYPIHDEVDYWRFGPGALEAIPAALRVERFVHLGGRMSSVTSLLQRPPGVWRPRQAVYKMVGLPLALLGGRDQCDDSPLGIGLVIERTDAH